MGRNYLAFDIETAKDVPGPDFNWKRHRPLGITCIASGTIKGTQLFFCVVTYSRYSPKRTGNELRPLFRSWQMTNTSRAYLVHLDVPGYDTYWRNL